MGIKNLKDAQIIFLDTPGIHKPKYRLNELIVKEALNSIREVDLVCLLVDPVNPTNDDISIIHILKDLKTPLFLVINKIDTVKKDIILTLISEYSNIRSFNEFIPISALKGDGTDRLVNEIANYLPEGPRYYPEEIVTDRMERFMVAEIIRERVIRHTTEEVPHSTAVEVMRWKEKKNGLISIYAVIYIEKKSQKGIIIGREGKMLKLIGSEARVYIERVLNTKVYLELFVKVNKDWRKDSAALKELGFL